MKFMSIKSSETLDFSRYVVTRFFRHNCIEVAASLTFTTLLSLVPLVAIGLTLVAAFPAFSEYSIQIKIFLLTTMVPETAGKVITVYMQQFADNAVQLTAIGIAFLAVTAFTLLLTIDKELNAIWHVTKPRPLLYRLLIYWTLLTVGPLLIGASLTLTSWLVGLSLGLMQGVPGFDGALLQLVPLLLTTIAFSALYLIMPNRQASWYYALVGGMVAAVAFEGMKHGFAFYIANFPAYQMVYGAFATIPIFLLWIYLSWLAVLLGAVIAASLSSWNFGEWRRDSSAFAAALAWGGQFPDALHLLRVLSKAFNSGGVETYRSLRQQLALGFEEMEQMLERLSSADIVRRVGAGGWVQSRDPEVIMVADIYRLFGFNPEAARATALGDAKLKQLLDDIDAGISEKMNLSLATFFAETHPPLAVAT